MSIVVCRLWRVLSTTHLVMHTPIYVPPLSSCYEIHGHLLHRELGFGDSEYVDSYLFAAIMDRLCISIIYKLLYNVMVFSNI